jgi:hypothetical protein
MYHQSSKKKGRRAVK